MYYMGFSYRKCYTLPIWQRNWFMERLNTEIQKAQGVSKSPTSNEPQTRALQGRQRSQVPARLRRFT